MSKQLNEEVQKLFSGFSKLNKKERYQKLVEMGALDSSDVEYLQKKEPVSFDLAEKFIENVIGYFHMPMGVVTNFIIDEKPYVIPMAVEETSIIAAASKTAKWVKENGYIKTEVIGQEIIGQIQIPKVKNYEFLSAKLAENKQNLIDQANVEVAAGLVRRGGGVTDIKLRPIERPDGGMMAVIHVMANTCEAMGANIINQVTEFLKPIIQQMTGEELGMCILSNLVDTKVTRATVVLKNINTELGKSIEEGSLFSQIDPYRAATNNKGVLNGIDPILIATGNDWRAVEAGIHAYASRTGQYTSITKWTYNEDTSELTGVFEAPIVVGTVGGVTKLHPTAQLSLKMMGIESSNELSQVCAAVGLVQNLGAIKALTTVGIIEGHMKLHIQNLTLGAGAEEREIPIVQKKLEEILKLKKRISLSHAIEVLKELRSSHKVTTQHNEVR
ncbi:MAG: hydroxymethylglutaryl-CoA reductase, degradative [Bdellovibrionales bacterium]|nr:hydroxymethylglutaryl-CoA reductase, degradative [Bdellovibrionales bacterium]